MIEFHKGNCTGCGICVKVCPQGVAVLENKKAVMADYLSCMECGACSLNCVFNAIELTKGTGCRWAIVKEDILKVAPKGTGCGFGKDDQGDDCC